MSQSRRGGPSPQLALTASARPSPVANASSSRLPVIRHRPQQQHEPLPSQTRPGGKQTQLDNYFTTKQRQVAPTSHETASSHRLYKDQGSERLAASDSQRRAARGEEVSRAAGADRGSGSPGPSSLLGKAPATTLKSQLNRQPQIITNRSEDEEEEQEDDAALFVKVQRMLKDRGMDHGTSSSSSRRSASPPPPTSSSVSSTGLTQTKKSSRRPVSAPKAEQLSRPRKSLRRSAPVPQTEVVECSSSPSSGEDEALSQQSVRQLVLQSTPETPWLHEELSALPWQEDAALKAAQYRISAGLQPTAKDIEARNAVMRARAQLAHRQAILRSAGIRPEDVEAFELAEGSRSSSRAKDRPATPAKRTATPMRDEEQIASKRQALAPRSAPNSPKPAKKPRPSELADSVGSQRHSQTKSEDEAEPSDIIRQSQSRTPASSHFPPLEVIRSPRTGRKIYALETQGDTSLPSPSDFRAQLLRAGQRPGIRPIRTRPRTSGGHQEHAAMEPASPPRRQSTGRPNLGDSLFSAKKLQRSPRKNKEAAQVPMSASSPLSDRDRTGYRADSSSPPAAPDSDGTPPMAGAFDDEVDDTVVAIKPARDSRQVSSPVHDEDTQPLAFDEADREATQVLPFDDGSETEEEEIILCPRGRNAQPLRQERTRILPSSQRRTSQSTPVFKNVAAAWDCDVNGPARRESQATRFGSSQKNDPPQTTLGRFGFDETRNTPRGSPSDRPSAAKARDIAIPAHFKDHPLSRDVRDELSDDEDDDSGFVDATKRPVNTAVKGRQIQRSPISLRASRSSDDHSSQGTQPLDRIDSSQSSHTEDEDIVPSHLVADKLTAWPADDGMTRRPSNSTTSSTQSSMSWPPLDSEGEGFFGRLPENRL